MAFQDIGWEGVDWIDLAEDRDKRRAAVNTVMNNSMFPFNVLIWNIYIYIYIYIYCAVLKRLKTSSDFHIPLPSIVPFAHS